MCDGVDVDDDDHEHNDNESNDNYTYDAQHSIDIDLGYDTYLEFRRIHGGRPRRLTFQFNSKLLTRGIQSSQPPRPHQSHFPYLDILISSYDIPSDTRNKAISLRLRQSIVLPQRQVEAPNCFTTLSCRIIPGTSF
jgi:hypothetical protein